MEGHLKVLFIPRWYPHRYDPMPGLFIERHARAVSKYVKVAVLYVHQDDRLTDQFMESEVSRDDELYQMKIYYRPSRAALPCMRRFVNSWRYFSLHFIGIKRIRKEFGDPDIIHVNVLTRLGIIALICKWFLGTPYIITEHWSRYIPQRDEFRGFLRKMVTRLVVRNASAVLPVTENLAKAMRNHGLKNRHYRVIPNVVDMEQFRIAENNPHQPKHQFIHVSCFEDQPKNISGILRVLKKLSLKRTDWECQLIGEGPDHEELISYARELGIEGTFAIFTGLKVNQELAGMMAGADFLLMFSRFENLPVVILESYACGVPVISTDVGGISEYMNEDLGILIHSEDEDQLLEKIGWMLDHHKDYSKDRIREYAIKHVSNEVIGAQLFEIYSKAASCQTGR